MRYEEFVELGYVPGPDELIALYRVKPAKGLTLEDAAGRIASESSVGTWTEVKTVTDFVRSIRARAYEINGNYVKIAYKPALFEPGNMPQIFSAIAGNIFGMKAVRSLRLEDVYWPRELVESFPGPLYGVKGVKDILKVGKRPITATVPKPKVGLNPQEYAEAAYEIMVGGIDLVKDDENNASMKFCKFKERVELVLKAREKAEREIGERKGYLANITAPYGEMLRRANLVKDLGGEFVMIDILTAGWSALQEFRRENEDLRLAIHAHRAFHAAFTRNPLHGVSMKVIAGAARLVGVDHLHIGTVIGKLESRKSEVLALADILRKEEIKACERRRLLEKRWWNKRSVIPVSSGGLHPGLIPYVIKLLGHDLIIQVGGGVMGHPRGPLCGARAVRQAIEAVAEGIDLEEYAKSHIELRDALSKWSFTRPV